MHSQSSEAHPCQRRAVDPPNRSPVVERDVRNVEELHATRYQRILIVEDEIFVRLDVEQQLSAAGYDVVGQADTADEAVKIALAEKPDVVLMDIRLRGARDGIDAALEIRQRLNIACIFVSANTDPATMRRAQTAQPLGFVTKPFTLPALVAAMTPKN